MPRSADSRGLAVCGKLSHYALELDNDRLHKLPQQGQWVSFSPMVTASVTFNSRKAFRSVSLALQLRRKPKPLLSLRKVFTISLLVVKNFLFSRVMSGFSTFLSLLFVWSRYWLESNSNRLNVFNFFVYLLSSQTDYLAVFKCYLFPNYINFSVQCIRRGGGGVPYKHTRTSCHPCLRSLSPCHT